MRRTWLAAATAIGMAAVSAVAVAASASARTDGGEVPGPGSASLGDRLLPGLGNGGYRAGHYDLSFGYDPEAKAYHARTVIDARATQALSRFDLDFAGNTVRQVTVNGQDAAWRQVAQKLIVTPVRPLPDRRALRVAVTYTGSPAPHAGPGPGEVQGFFPTADGFFLASEPDAAHSVFPCNDYPADKASVDFHLTVPASSTAAANGVLTSVRRHGSLVTWNWAERAPIATYLVQIAIGRYAMISHSGPGGLPLRDVVPVSQAAALRPVVARTPGQLAWLEQWLGRYPFAAYGLLAVNSDIEFLNETQTLTVAPVPLLLHGIPGYPEWLITQYALTHELTHQWFGDSVSPATWSDLWLNEGPATYYGFLYAAGHGGTSFADDVKQWYADDKNQRPVDGPPAVPSSAAFLFNGASVDYTGALVLYALQQKVGAPAFGKIMRAWVSEYRGRSASTADFIRTASKVSGRDLAGFLHAWLYGKVTPPLP